MGLVQPELSLDFRHTIVLKTIGDFLKEVSMIGNVKERLSKLDGFVKGLEEEMRKIDAFKRELPLCMLLLNDAIMALKEETMQCTAQNAKPILAEFIPLKKDCDENEEKDYKDKKNWMSSVQLFPTTDIPYNSKQNSKVESKRNEEENCFVTEDLFQLNKNMAGSRTYMPFKPGFLETVVERKGGKEGLPIHGLSLLTPGIKNLGEESGSSGSKTSCSRSVSSSTTANVQSNLRMGPQQQQTARKQRRCWSPELHRRFVNALQQLGGSQAATPKQIRELMQVDGLTNDEVKSHLQKYRLHTRRLPAASTTPANQSAGVLGGLWMPQDQYNNSSKASSSQSGSPQGPLQLAGAGGGTSTTGADSMDDDEEDQKSESYNWKSHIHKSGKDDV